MGDWLADIPNLGVPGVLGVQSQKSAVSPLCSGVLDGVPGVLECPERTPGTPGGTPSTKPNRLKINEEHSEHREHRISEEQAREALKFWHSRLSTIDALKPPACMSSAEWEDLCDDAFYIYENFGSYAVRNGWRADGLFGVRVDYAPGGGLAQVLRRSRTLMFDGPIAHMTRFGVAITRNPACGYGLPLVWELAMVNGEQ